MKKKKTKATIIPETDLHGNCRAIEYIEDENSCWICTSHSSDKQNYPEVVRKKRYWRMSRYIYTLKKGRIPTGLHVLHNCDNPSCIRPEHLRVGTHQENMNDKTKRGRCPSKLKKEDVIHIRGDTKSTYIQLARRYGVSIGTIGSVKRNKLWRHVT